MTERLEKEKDWLDHGWDAEIKMREIKFRGKAVMSIDELDVLGIKHNNGNEHIANVGYFEGVDMEGRTVIINPKQCPVIVMYDLKD